MPFSNDYAHNILNYLFSKTNQLTPPESIYIGLSTTDPTNGSFNEIVGGSNGYHRVLICKRGSGYPDVIGSASNRAISNINQINWTKATADWPEAVGFGLFSSEQGGSPFFYGLIETPVTCAAGSVALLDPNTMKISFPTADIVDVTEG